jgi:5-oxoprolinase (ATP-hydrolysing) subunit C
MLLLHLSDLLTLSSCHLVIVSSCYLVMSLRVLEPGLHTLLVDFGRSRSRSLGVPIGGAADRFALAIGNALVGNQADACALEISLMGPMLRAECDLACVVYGAPFDFKSDRQELRPSTTFTLHAGEEIKIGGTAKEMRSYFCVAGGLQSRLVLGSRSGLHPLKAGVELGCVSGTIRQRFIANKFEWNREPHLLRVTDGPQAAWFHPDELFSQEFVVLPASNRMGLRLSSEPLTRPERELTSEAVCPGSVQVTRDGQCIVIGVDGQTIGGYPKIAQVISVDLDKLGQLRPDDRIRFAPVTLPEAERLYRWKKNELNEWLTRLRTAELFGP